MREAIGEEYKEYIKKLGTVDQHSNPMNWWRTQEGFSEVKPVLEGALLLPGNFSFRQEIVQHGRADLHPTEHRAD